MTDTRPTYRRITGTFVLPQLPKPDYLALKKLCGLLSGEVDGSAVTQLEIVCVGIRLICEKMTSGEQARVIQELVNFRSTAPSEQPPLL